jgi:hypothetical protein
MKIDKPSVGIPSSEDTVHALPIQRFLEIQQPSQLVASAYVVTRENMQTT